MDEQVGLVACLPATVLILAAAFIFVSWLAGSLDFDQLLIIALLVLIMVDARAHWFATGQIARPKLTVSTPPAGRTQSRTTHRQRQCQGGAGRYP